MLTPHIRKPPAHPLSGLRGQALTQAESGIPLRLQIERAARDRVRAETAAPSQEDTMSKSSSKSHKPAGCNATHEQQAKRSARKPQSSKSTRKQEANVPAKSKSVVTVKDVAEKLNADPKDLRAFMRSELGLSAGRGKSYSWSSLKHPQVKRIISAYSAAE